MRTLREAADSNGERCGSRRRWREMAPVKVKVLLFAKARELAGVAELEMEVELGETTEECAARVVKQFPALQPVREGMVLALNRDYVDEPVALKDGDELAFIPPISGG